MLAERAPAEVIRDPQALTLRPGEARRVWLGVGDAWDGPVRVPLYVARGRTAGPKLVAVATQHGDEAYGLLGLLDLMDALDPETLRGEVWLVPCLNTFGFIAGHRVGRFDFQDMNRVHPGKVDGTFTEQIAHAVYTQVLPDADLLLDLHGGSVENGDIPFGRWTDAPDKVSVLPTAQRLGLRFLLLPGGDVPGMLTTATPAAGVPQISIEAGNCTAYPRDNARQMRGFVEWAMNALGMTDVDLPPIERPAFARTVSHKATVAGAFTTLVSFGESVQAGQLLGTVRDLLGQEVQRVHASESGVVAVMRTGVRVHAGESLTTLCVPTAAPAGLSGGKA